MFNLPVFLLAVCTAYTPALDECAKTDGITASGAVAIQGVTVASDALPFGTELIINNHKYIVQDRFGGGYATHRIDIFMNNKEEAFKFGRQTKVVEVRRFTNEKEKNYEVYAPAPYWHWGQSLREKDYLHW